MVSGAGYVFEEPKPDGIVTEIMIEAVDERRVRPMKIDRRKFDAVATIRRRRLLELAAQIGDHRILAVDPQGLELFRRQGRRFIGSVADRKIDAHQRGDRREQIRAAQQPVASREDKRDGERGKNRACRERPGGLVKMALHARDKQRDREQRGDGADKPSRAWRGLAPLNEIEAIAREDRERRAEQECSVGRPPPKVDARQMIEEGEDRRVAAQGVEGEKQRGGGEEADFLIRKEAPAQRRDQRYERQFAQVNIGHVAREE